MVEAYINRIATSVPPYDVHGAFVGFGHSLFDHDPKSAALFGRMAGRAGIDHRYSFLSPENAAPNGGVVSRDFYVPGKFPSTAARMRLFEKEAPQLAEAAIAKLDLGRDHQHITHLVLTCCTGFSAPGLDLQIMTRCGLPGSTERTMIGFMGCYAAINALKLARHIVRSEPDSRVLVVNIELCSLHLQETANLDQILSFLIFSDGCAACLVTADPIGFAIDSFRSVLVPNTEKLITWHIGDSGFDMILSGQVPATIHDALRSAAGEILNTVQASSIDLWAVHPGGRSILDAVERGFHLRPNALSHSREVLRRFGNMSSATVMFVLESLLHTTPRAAKGCAISFGPGLMAETMLFHAA